MSMRSAASCSQPLQLSSVPRGARMTGASLTARDATRQPYHGRESTWPLTCRARARRARRRLAAALGRRARAARARPRDGRRDGRRGRRRLRRDDRLRRPLVGAHRRGRRARSCSSTSCARTRSAWASRCPAEVVRGMLLLLANSLSKGHSGVRPELVELLLGLLERDVLPVVPSRGSVGASGDLAPLAHVAVVLCGEGARDLRRRASSTAARRCGAPGSRRSSWRPRKASR